MTEELGKIERPEAARFRGERKLYVVPLLFAGKDAPPDFTEKFALYWQQVGEQISNQETKIGRVARIYHESVALGGQDGLAVLEKLNPPGHRLVQEKCRAGAAFEATELAEITDECMDWERFLMIGFLSRRVGEMVTDFYRESTRRRYEHISRRIDETLGANEVAVLFIREGHMVQFPSDVEVFMIAPPALDAIHRWLRDRPAADEEPPAAEGEDLREEGEDSAQSDG